MEATSQLMGTVVLGMLAIIMCSAAVLGVEKLMDWLKGRK